MVPTNEASHTCSNINKCYCNLGWSGADCSIQIEIIPTLEPTNEASHVTSKNDDLSDQMQKKETPYGRRL
ncbi:Disintegrin and metalloproteinase domain-containing protein 22 [Homalodisca vitripennis]|nr:Disintegrin and metalloproteinase domain-containing protein 22 [Homalodisca vitripennis]